MILVDTSFYIDAIRNNEIEKLLEELSQKAFIQSCDIIEKEIHAASEFLRKTGRKEESEKLRLIFDKIHEGNIRTSERIINLAREYHKEAELSQKHNKGIASDFLIVASAAIAGVKNILSLNRATMASQHMVQIYSIVNKRKGYRTPVFLTTEEELRRFLKSF